MLATLRGASAEITDLAIDSENTLIAAGSCDKVIRVWSLQTLAPVAVLSSHTGMITALQFCPAPDDEGVLVSTGGDGCVAFWTFTRHSQGTVKFDSKPLKLNERVRPGHAQLICASFTTGGHFLAVGGADHFVRVYRLNGDDGIEKLIEVERHQDRVDSIQWCHRSLAFVTGSRDGTALIWRYQRQQWKTIQLNVSQKLPGCEDTQEEIKKFQVTMVGWDRTDKFVITASNDKILRLWDSLNGALLHMLSGHEENVYVIEAHPTNERLILTAGHDGQLFVWDVISGVAVKNFMNRIEGQGYGALFDAKWSPDGFTIAATDSHGHLSIYGIGPDHKYKKIPQELFFHTDYRPLVRDVNHHVLDEQTQLAPHLMPPPFLVNMDGDPYPPNLQRLVPGRELCKDDQLVPNIILNANGEQEVMDFGSHDLPPAPVIAVPVPLGSNESGTQPSRASGEQIPRPNIDQMIQLLVREQDQRYAASRSVSVDAPGSSNETAEARSNHSGGDHSYAAANNPDPLSPRASELYFQIQNVFIKNFNCI